MKLFRSGKKDGKSDQPSQTPPPQQPPPKSSNPYAAPTTPSGGYGGYSSDKPSGGYGGGYGGYGGGYGSQKDDNDDATRGALFGNRSANNKSPAPTYTSAAPSYSSGGYNSGNTGGYGTPRNEPLDANREQLFGNRTRQPPPPAGYGAPPSGGYGSAPSGGYGAPPPRREGLSPEEEEEEDVDAIKQQIRFTKQESVNSTRRALAAAAQAEETGRATLTRLGQQGERLTNTKKNLDLAGNQNRKAEAAASELQTLNRSMFAVHVGNPFNSARKQREEEDKIMQRHQLDIEERERVRQAGYEGKKNVEQGLGGPMGRGGYGAGAGRGGYGGYGANALSNAERNKYQFEADESDDEKEREIEHNLDQIGNTVSRLKTLALSTNKEVDRQIDQIDELDKNTTKVEMGIARNTHRLHKIN